MSGSKAPFLRDGWIPIEINTNPVWRVRWMECDPAALCDPFFSQTITKLRAVTPTPRQTTTSIRSLLSIAASKPAIVPAGVIFHISRCGSTLLANGLRALGENIVISEAQPIGTFLTPGLALRDLVSNVGANPETLLSAVLTILGYSHGKPAERVILKCASANILEFALLRQCWPEVPCVVVVRNPVEVVISNLTMPGAWMRIRTIPGAGSELLGWDAVSVRPEQMTSEEYCSRVIGTFCECAVRLAKGGSCKIIDYENIDVRRICNIGEWFGLKVPQDYTRRLAEVTVRYSKDSMALRRFEPDGHQKRQAASDRVINATHEWAQPAYNQLRPLDIF